jgi:membrane associated rhomboid family serine protease
MATSLKSVEYQEDPTQEPETPGWFGVGLFAAASALVGGLAVAWYYRGTLRRLRQAEALEAGDLAANDDGEGI